MTFTRATLYDAPFPSDDLRRDDGTIDLSKIPNPQNVTLIDQALALLGEAHGFGMASAIYFRMGGSVDPKSLPSLTASTQNDASVLLVSVQPGSPDYLRPHPIDVAFIADGGPFGDANLLALLPLQGVPLRPNTRYAAVLTDKLRDAKGRPIARAAAMHALANNQPIAGLTGNAYHRYADALQTVKPFATAEHIVALAVFTTDDPTAQLKSVTDAAQAAHPIRPPTAFTLTDTFPDYCVYQSTVMVPTYQSGAPPYQVQGGTWKLDAKGHALYDHSEAAHLYVTIPRAPMPAGGWPTVVFVRTGGGGDRPLIDRGPASTTLYNGAPDVPGTGPAMHFARVGFAGVQIDGPLGGLRNPSNGNEDFLIFNVQNAGALRDNVRESAMELSLLARMLPSLTVPTPDCPGTSGGAQTVDAAHLALMGHSMGSWIAPLTLAYERSYGAAIFSGAGASYVNNIMDKLMPLDVRPYAELLLGFDQDQRTLERHDPALMIVQWAAEPSDPQVYDRLIVREPPSGAAPTHLLMLQGIVDHYILPSIANATSLALGLDAADPLYDATNAEEMKLGQPPLGPLLPLVSARTLALPASGNIGSATALLVQHPGDMIEDGHEVVFQTDPPKHQYRCFLQSWLHGTPRVPPDGAADDPCN